MSSSEEGLGQPLRRLQIVVDIDDTVKSSGNVRFGNIPLGGIDGQYERGAFYPGVFEFVAELARARSSSEEPEPVAVLTARAREFKFALELNDEDKVVRGFRRVGRKMDWKKWGVCPERVLYGSAHEWLFQDFKAWRKFLNFEILAASLGDLGDERPQREYIFIGDTGEMDRQAGELILGRHPELVNTVFLHCVSENETGKCFVPVDYAVGSKGRVYHFRTYIGAALKAVKARILDREAFERIVKASFHDLDVRGVTNEHDPNNQRHDLNADLKLARAYFAKHHQQKEDATNDNKASFLLQRLFFPHRDAEEDKIFIDDDDDDDDWSPNRDYRDALPWWERPLLSRFLNVGGSSKKVYTSRRWRPIETARKYTPVKIARKIPQQIRQRRRDRKERRRLLREEGEPAAKELSSSL